MNVGEAAQRSGLPAKTLRYYEEIGLVAPDRAANGYRFYNGGDVHFLRFLKRARRLGFAIEECRQLLALYRDKDRTSHDVRKLAIVQLTAIEGKIAELNAMRSTLRHLVEACHGDARPDCPILEDISGEG